jgi:hypothetical protein
MVSMRSEISSATPFFMLPCPAVAGPSPTPVRFLKTHLTKSIKLYEIIHASAMKQKS